VIRDVVTHVIVSSVMLAIAMIAATWIRPLTARTRHALLVAGLLALALPAPLLTNLLERNDLAPLPVMTNVVTGFSPSLAAVPKPSRDGLKPVVTLWAVVAAILLIRWWIVTRRLVQTAMRAATTPPARTVRALEAARRRLGIHQSIDLITSPTCEAPAVGRVLRPMSILPADGCESLDDEELESLLCHECAHVARRDNLLGVLEAVACSLFWFNPLVWLAHRRIAAAREAACDERVADAALRAETYVGALAKICRTLLAPRVPAVSCMASAHLKERIQHLMSYDTLRRSALPHTLIVAVAVAGVVTGIAAAGALTAQPTTVEVGKYTLNYSMNKRADGQLDVRVQIVDSETKEAVAAPAAVATRPGSRATIRVGSSKDGDEREYLVTIEPNADSSGQITLVATHNGREIQNTSVHFPAPGAQVAQQWSGAPLSLNLSNADFRDVMRVFGQLSGTDITVAPDVQGSVNVNITDMPWDQAFDQIVRENGYAYRTNAGKIEVFKP
jgi:beta-lactamase regulating signal transducer with metallopeptidase domain